jgi:hypothetical protein
MEEATSIDATVATLVPPAAGPASRPEPAAAAPAAAWFSLDTDVGLGGEPVREWLAVSPVGLSVTAREVPRGDPVPAEAIRQAAATWLGQPSLSLVGPTPALAAATRAWEGHPLSGPG